MAKGGLRQIRYAVTARSMGLDRNAGVTASATDGGGGGGGGGLAGTGTGSGGDTGPTQTTTNAPSEKTTLALLIASKMAASCGIGGLPDRALQCALGANVCDLEVEVGEQERVIEIHGPSKVSVLASRPLPRAPKVHGWTVKTECCPPLPCFLTLRLSPLAHLSKALVAMLQLLRLILAAPTHKASSVAHVKEYLDATGFHKEVGGG